MKENFNVIFLGEARDFLAELDIKARTKILFNIRKAQVVHDPRLFKKLNTNIWEFRTQYLGKQYRLFAFWDKREYNHTLVVSTHGTVKKTNKVPKKEIDRAEKIRLLYFDE